VIWGVHCGLCWLLTLVAILVCVHLHLQGSLCRSVHLGIQHL
jgi:hypothetical protein